MEKKTALYDCHVACGGKIVPFAGYSLPVQYETGVIKEHMAVRTKVGMFDVSHMGEVLFEGEDALKNLNYIMTNDFTNMYDGQVRYSPMCYDNGGVVDDLLVYKYNDKKYFVVVNAANREKDVKWIEEHLTGDVKFTDISDTLSQIALQGPLAHKVICKLCKEDELPKKYYSFNPDMEVAGARCIVSQTGYTGESGYEIYLPNDDAAKVWNALLEAGKEDGLIPCGLGARDTLRMEAAMPLYGHEMDETVDPLETGLKFAVKMKKDDFIGKKAMEEKGAFTRTRVGLKVTGKGIARENEKIFVGDKEVGHTTSGTHAPFLGYAVAMALISVDYAEEGTQVEVDVRGRRVAAEVVKLPFYKKAE